MQQTRGSSISGRATGGLVRAANIGLAGLALLACAAAAEEPTGRPAIQRFATDLEVYPRNFAVEQGPSGIVYVGNAEGVLSFDGTRWHLHKTNSEELVRTLVHDGDRRLYVGGYNGFGYFETPIGPESEYVDLTGAFGIEDPDFADIWQLEVAPEGVFFLALENLYRLDPETGETRHWEREGRFGAMGRIDGELFVQFRGEGMRVWRDGDFVPVEGTDGLADQVYSLLALPGGGFLTTARDGRWLSFRDGRVEAFDVPDDLPESSQFTATAVLDDGVIALGSLDGRLYFLDTVENTLASFRLSGGWIADLARTPEGGVIAQTDHETLYIRWPAKWSAWGSDHGLTGNVMEVLRWQDRWLVVSNGGALLSSETVPVTFEALPWTDFEAWDFEPLGDGTGLLAETYTLKHVSLDGVIQEIKAVQYPRVVVPSRYDESVFLVGTESGLAVLRRGPRGFDVVASAPKEFAPVFAIAELAAGRVLLGTQGKGVWEARFDETPDDPKLIERNAGIEFPDARYASLVEIGERVLALTEGAAWRWTGDGFEPAGIDGLDTIRREGRYLNLVDGPDGEIWAFDFNHLYRRGDETGWQEMNVGALRRGAFSSIDFDPSGRVLVGASGSVIILDPDSPELKVADHDVMLRSVRLETESGDARLLDPDRAHSIPAQPLSIRFDYSLPGVNARDEIRYRARLKGYEPEFTDWQSTTHYTYFNLDPGRYVFEVAARGPSGRVSRIESFEFRVVPPWYRAPWILSLQWPGLALLLGLLIWMYMRARMWRLEGERKRLAEQVRKRTQALVAANRKLKQMAEIDELTGIANRRSFDQYLRQQVVQCRAGERPLALALIDLDQFKPYNDRHGHLAGDRVLRDIARCLTEGFGNHDVLVARFGGDEFAAILPGLDLDSASELAERTREHCAGACGEVRLSIGIAAVRPGQQVDSIGLLEAADHQLYEIKRSGQSGTGAAWVEGS